MTLAENIDIAVIAKRTPGLVGADLANIANERRLWQYGSAITRLKWKI